MTWSAEEIPRTADLPESVMDSYRRAVFNEHATGNTPMTAQELRDTQTALLDYVRRDLPDELTGEQEKLLEGIAEWDELLEAAKQEAA